jgi:hypothetical protein
VCEQLRRDNFGELVNQLRLSRTADPNTAIAISMPSSAASAGIVAPAIANDGARVGQRPEHVDVEAFIFFVGDDWTVAVAVDVVLALAVTYGLSRAGVPAW